MDTWSWLNSDASIRKNIIPSSFWPAKGHRRQLSQRDDNNNNNCRRGRAADTSSSRTDDGVATSWIFVGDPDVYLGPREKFVKVGADRFRGHNDSK